MIRWGYILWKKITYCSIFFEMRLILEPQMIRLAAIRGTDEEIIHIQKAYEQVMRKK